MEGIEAYALPDVPVVVHKSTGLVPAYKVLPAVGCASALAGVFYLWYTKKFADRLPHTLSPSWKLAEMLRFYNCPREAGDPVILNPLRQCPAHPVPTSTCAGTARYRLFIERYE